MGKSSDWSTLSAYAQAMGMEVTREGDASPIVSIDYDPKIAGRPGALHGGAIGGILETAGYTAVRCALEEQGRKAELKPVNITVQFLRSGKLEKTQASAKIKRLGRRVANVTVEAWQEDPARPIATAVMNIMLVEEA